MGVADGSMVQHHARDVTTKDDVSVASVIARTTCVTIVN